MGQSTYISWWRSKCPISFILPTHGQNKLCPIIHSSKSHFVQPGSQQSQLSQLSGALVLTPGYKFSNFLTNWYKSLQFHGYFNIFYIYFRLMGKILLNPWVLPPTLYIDPLPFIRSLPPGVLGPSYFLQVCLPYVRPLSLSSFAPLFVHHFSHLCQYFQSHLALGFPFPLLLQLCSDLAICSFFSCWPVLCLMSVKKYTYSYFEDILTVQFSNWFVSANDFLVLIIWPILHLFSSSTTFVVVILSVSSRDLLWDLLSHP